MGIHDEFFKPQWKQLSALIGSFLGAIGLGSFLARFLMEPSEIAMGVSCFTFLLILFVGYQLWITFIAAKVSRGFLRGFWNSTVRYVFRRDERSVREAAEDLLKDLRDEEKIKDLMISIRSQTSLFRKVGLVFGLLGGVLLSTFWSISGFWLSWTAYTICGYLYGWVLAGIGGMGYLPIPEDIDF